jgi:hypothetical protein
LDVEEEAVLTLGDSGDPFQILRDEFFSGSAVRGRLDCYEAR